MAGPTHSVAVPSLVAVASVLLASLPRVAAEACTAGACAAGQDSAALLQLHSVEEPVVLGADRRRQGWLEGAAVQCARCYPDASWCKLNNDVKPFWNICSNSKLACLCPAMCQPSCAQGPPLPDCTGSQKTNACLARRLACWLDWQLSYKWSSNNTAIQTTHRQLHQICKLGELRATSGALGSSSVPSLSQSSCSKPSCAPDVVAKKKDDPSYAFAMKTAKSIAAGALNMVKLILKSTGEISLAGDIAFSFMSAFLGAFFPSSSSPSGPCHLAVNYGQCMWQQVKPFVEQYVQDQIADSFEQMWRAYILGYQREWSGINSTAYDNSQKFPNGTVKHMSKGVEDRMYEDLHTMWLFMRRDSEVFLLDYAINTTNGIYLAQYASMQISVATSLFGSWQFRTLGDRNNFQRDTLCYNHNVFVRAMEQRIARLASMGKQVTPDTSITDPNHWTYFDHFKGCSWSMQCGFEDSIIPCYTEQTCWQQHVDYVTEQTDELWSDWLAPLPEWLQQVIDMDKAVLRNTSVAPPTDTLSCKLP
mmetsp:Transcript_78563/g.197408  ORF Transcript_78563/g.197408 Transcript_78563/m.197408 type:complete len:533 (+) Transcript_78563:65-1663(+)